MASFLFKVLPGSLDNGDIKLEWDKPRSKSLEVVCSEAVSALKDVLNRAFMSSLVLAQDMLDTRWRRSYSMR